MSNHPERRHHGPAWLERGAKLRGMKIRTRAKGARGDSPAPRSVRSRLPAKPKQHRRIRRG